MTTTDTGVEPITDEAAETPQLADCFFCGLGLVDIVEVPIEAPYGLEGAHGGGQWYGLAAKCSICQAQGMPCAEIDFEAETRKSGPAAEAEEERIAAHNWNAVAARLAKLEAENARLREALTLAADTVEKWGLADDGDILMFHDEGESVCRAARAALQEPTDGE